MSLELYSYWRSSASYRVRIALNLKSLPYVYHGVNLMKDGGEQWKPEYRAVNPQSRVPTLVHDGQRFTQSLAIIEYLDEVFPGPRLMPQRPGGSRARAHAVADHRLRHPAAAEHQHHEIPQGKAQLDDAAIADWLREWITRGLDAFNAHLEHDHLCGKFCHGDTPTMADCCLVPQMFAAERFGVRSDALPAARADRRKLQSPAGLRSTRIREANRCQRKTKSSPTPRPRSPGSRATA